MNLEYLKYLQGCIILSQVLVLMVMMKAVCCNKHWLDLCYPTDNNFDDANVYHFVINYIIPLCQPHPSKPYLSNQTQKLSSNQKFLLGPLSKDFQLSYLFYLHHKGNLIDLNDGPLYFYTIDHSCWYHFIVFVMNLLG